MSDEELEPGNRRRRVVAAAAAAAVVVVALVVWLLGRGGDEVALEEPTPTPTATGTATAEPTEESPSPEPPAEEETGEPEEPTAPPQAQPTAADAATFADAHGPADRTETGDVTGDGVDEVVVARVVDDTARIVVGQWDGAAYRRVFRDDGGPAQSIASLEIADYNGERGAEIVTEQRFGETGASLAVWGSGDGGIERQVAEGGCWDGFHTYGRAGATIEPMRITATCDGSPLPPEAWTSDIYEWTVGAWVYARTQEQQ